MVIQQKSGKTTSICEIRAGAPRFVLKELEIEAVYVYGAEMGWLQDDAGLRIAKGIQNCLSLRFQIQ
jgi:hypothetical protein